MENQIELRYENIVNPQILKDAVLNGEINPLDFIVFCKRLESCIKILSDEQIDKLAVTEAEKYGKKSFEYQGAKCTITEVGTKYDFSVCEDSEYAVLEQRLADAKAKLDERKKMLQSIPLEGQLIGNEQTGEFFKVYPPIKRSTTKVSISFKK